VPFKISEKKVTYLGEITVDISDCQFVGRREDPKIKITAINQWQRDRKLFEQRLPKIGMKDVVIGVLRP
jgi:hypothetical protein